MFSSLVMWLSEWTRNSWTHPSYETLSWRMSKVVSRYNDRAFHCYKPFVITVKSKQLLSYINKVTDIKTKLEFLTSYNDILVSVCERLYHDYDPTMIYAFNNEITLVFFYNDYGDYKYNGNINRLLTSVASDASLHMYKKLQESQIDLHTSFSATCVEFSDDYEVMNYVIWRQMDCKRNTITLLHKCLYTSDPITNVKLDTLQFNLDGYLTNAFMHGNIIKKQLYYTVSDTPKVTVELADTFNVTKPEEDTLVTRKKIVVHHKKLSKSFMANFITYISNKVL